MIWAAVRGGNPAEESALDQVDGLDPAPEEVDEGWRAGGYRYGLGDASRVDARELTWAGHDARGRAQLERNPDVTLCFAMMEGGPRRGQPCERPAGLGTSHPGVGRCRWHGGETREGLMEASWAVAHAFARELECTPWEALLKAVRIAAGRVAFCEGKLAGAYSDRQLEPPLDGDTGRAGRVGEDGDNLHYWVKQAELWHDKLARVAKLAIDAGVAERLVRQVELEGELMLRAANLSLDELDLDDETRQRLLSALARNLVALESAENGRVIEGTVSGGS